MPFSIASDFPFHIENLFLLKPKISTEWNQSHILAKEKNKNHFINFSFYKIPSEMSDNVGHLEGAQSYI